MTRLAPKLASATSIPPTTSSYWVVPGLLLAGAYPGHPDTDERERKVRTLVDAGMRMFVNLMEEHETNYAGMPFVPYQDVATRFCPDITCVRYPIRDLHTPTMPEMVSILDTIDKSVMATRPTYVHCWGGVGRTGTVIGCWLLRHGLAEPSNVLNVLMTLRQQDQERRNRMSPESWAQQRFVKSWQEEMAPRA